MHYLGVDPGKKGAIAVLDDQAAAVDVIPIPMREGEHDPHGIAEQLHLWYKLLGPFHATVEKLQQLPPDRQSTPGEIRRQLQRGKRPTGRTPLGGGKANFERGCSVCGWRWLLSTFKLFRPNITFEFVSPRAWQKAMFEEIVKGDPKESSLRNARRIFPGVRLIPPRGRVENNNYADALLIGLFGKEKTPWIQP